MATIDYLPFGLNGSANVDTQANWVASHTGGYGDVGFQPGLAQSAQANKIWRQSSFWSAAMANYVSQALGGANILDDGNLSALITNITNAIKATAASSLGSLPPQGRLTLATGNPVLNSDAIAQTVVYYTAYVGNQVPVWNGSQFSLLSFAADVPLSLTAAASANAIVDVFGFSNAGVLQTGFGPVWGASGAGAGSRGTGAGTTALARQNGIWTNAFPITLLNGATSYPAIPANQATYLGSILVDGTAGQVSCHTSLGQSRKFGVWNAYNRKPITMQANDPTGSWFYGGAAWRPSNGNAANSISVFSGLAEEVTIARFNQWLANNESASSAEQIGIGLNSTSATPAGVWGRQGGGGSVSFTTTATALAELIAQPTLGQSTLFALESTPAPVSNDAYFGGSAMLLQVAYQG